MNPLIDVNYPNTLNVPDTLKAGTIQQTNKQTNYKFYRNQVFKFIPWYFNVGKNADIYFLYLETSFYPVHKLIYYDTIWLSKSFVRRGF